MNKYILFLTAMAVAGITICPAQQLSEATDKYTLLTTPYSNRPLNLFSGQLQVNAGYKFAVMAREFDSEGKLIILKDMGIASVYHYYYAEIRYGLTRFMELSATTNYLKRGIRSHTVTYMSTVESVTVNNLNEEKGMGDILFAASARLPIDFKIFDVGASGGIYLPSAEYKPRTPEHSVTDILSANSFTVNYHYNNTNGYGVPVLMLSAAAKATYQKFSFETRFTLRDPVKEGENIRWDQNLTASKTFVYTSETYKYLLNRTTDISLSLHYQAAGWFNVKVNMNQTHSSGGWTEYWGNKYRNPERDLLTIEPGFEIQVSPSVTVYQTAGFPVAGKNLYAPFYLNITLSYNLFPFLR